jgi:hypothetical protein
MVISNKQPRDYLRAIIDLSAETIRELDIALDQGDSQEAINILKRLRSSISNELTAAENMLKGKRQEPKYRSSHPSDDE